MLEDIFADQDRLKPICVSHGIVKLSMVDQQYYSSEILPDHDLILLVEFAPNQQVSYFDLLRAARDLSNLLGDKKIDLRTRNSLRAYHRQEMLDSAVVQYAA